MREGLAVGSQAELIWKVGAEHVIEFGANRSGFRPETIVPGAVVFSTPNMILLMERSARKVLEPFLEPHEESVGAQVHVDHLAPTPLGASVRGVARVTKIEGRLVDFEIAAYDDRDQIGSGSHRRAIVDLNRFAPKVAEKAEQLLGGTVMPMRQATEPQGQIPTLATMGIQLSGAIAMVTLTRAAKRNAVNQQMTSDFEQLNEWLAGRLDIRIVLLRSEGDVFCAGDDIPEVGTLDLTTARDLSLRQARAYMRWEQLPQVFIAVIQGPAMGGGCVMACACDFRIASHRAVFGMPEIALGWPPGYGIAQLTALVGKGRAMEMCVANRVLSAQEAQQTGLVTRLVAGGMLEAEARRMAQQLIALPAEAMRETKRLIHADEGLQPKTAYLADTEAYIRCLELPDAREGIDAFVKKRPPKFTGK
jgi:enoyl-CoA hydratase